MSQPETNTDLEDVPVDWFALKLEYLLSHLNGVDFAAAHEVDYKMMKHHLTRERWNEGRDELNARIEQQTSERAIASRVQAQALIDQTAHEAGFALIGRVVPLAHQTKDLGKVVAGARALRGLVGLLRVADGLAEEKPPPFDPQKPRRSRILRFMCDDGTVKYVNSATNEFVDPTPDCLPVGEAREP